MLYKTAFAVNEIPPLFVQLDKFEHPDETSDEPASWKEKARL